MVFAVLTLCLFQRKTRCNSTVRKSKRGLCVPETGTDGGKNKEQTDGNYRRSNHPASVSGEKSAAAGLSGD